MNDNSCPHCGSHLEPFWWERRLPQYKWTDEQKAASAERQRAYEQWNRLLQSTYSPDNTGNDSA